MFKRVFNLRFISNFSRRPTSSPKLPKLIAITGGTSLGIAFFGKTEENKNLDSGNGQLIDGKPKNFDLIVRNSDELYDNYLIDNCYNILKK